MSFLFGAWSLQMCFVHFSSCEEIWRYFPNLKINSTLFYKDYILPCYGKIMSSPGQKYGTCGHSMAVFDGHLKCARCGDKVVGEDLYVQTKGCHISKAFHCWANPTIGHPYLQNQEREIAQNAPLHMHPLFFRPSAGESRGRDLKQWEKVFHRYNTEETWQLSTLVSSSAKPPHLSDRKFGVPAWKQVKDRQQCKKGHGKASSYQQKPAKGSKQYKWQFPWIHNLYCESWSYCKVYLQKKGVNPNNGHRPVIKYVNNVSCVDHLSSVKCVTNVPTVTPGLPVGVRLDQ